MSITVSIYRYSQYVQYAKERKRGKGRRNGMWRMRRGRGIGKGDMSRNKRI